MLCLLWAWDTYFNFYTWKFHDLSLLCLLYLLFHQVDLSITWLYNVWGSYFSTMHALWIFPLHVLSLKCSWYSLFHRLNTSNTCLHYVCGTFPPCGYFHYMPSSYVCGTYFSTMWIFSSSLPRTTLCRSSLKAAMIPFILSNIMAIFSPLQEAWYWKTSLRTHCIFRRSFSNIIWKLCFFNKLKY